MPKAKQQPRVGRITKCAKRLVSALLREPGMCGTIDLSNSRKEATKKFADHGNWRGDVTKFLIRANIVEIVGLARSRRPSRNKGFVALLKIKDRSKANLFAASK